MLDKNTLDSVYRDIADGGYLDDWVLNCARAMRDQATAAIDLAAENELLKAKAKHYVCIRERNRETIDDLKGKLKASERENERLKSKLEIAKKYCPKAIQELIDRDGDET